MCKSIPLFNNGIFLIWMTGTIYNATSGGSYTITPPIVSNYALKPVTGHAFYSATNWKTNVINLESHVSGTLYYSLVSVGISF